MSTEATAGTEAGASTEAGVRPVPGRGRAAEIVAGYLSSLSIFSSVIALAWHPLRLVLIAMVLALVASGMSKGKRRLPFAAVMIAAVCFFLGMTIAVVTGRALY